MREIKFRAWYIPVGKHDSGFMFPVRLIDFGRMKLGDPAKFTVYMWYDEPSEYGVEQEDVYFYGDEIELMQFTGLHDKNGKEVFEGDVVLTNEAGWIAEVVYDRDRFMCEGRGGGYSMECEWEQFKVIGNVFENPELLNGRE